MACRNAYKTQKINVEADVVQTSISEPVVAPVSYTHLTLPTT